MEEASLGGMSIKWQNGTDRQMGMKKGPRRHSPLGRLPLAESEPVHFFKD
jgi:hypothetical protein